MTDPAVQKLWDRIPKGFQCVDGCTECCGPLQMSEAELRHFRLKYGVKEALELHTHTPPFDISCRCLKDGKCDDYENRPAICRGFGVVMNHRLTCPHVPARAIPEKITDVQFTNILKALEALP